MAISRESIVQVTEAVLLVGARKATKYLSPHETVRATFCGKRDRRRPVSHIVLTAGRPNYDERMFIKKALQSGMKFPMSHVVVKFDKPVKARAA